MDEIKQLMDTWKNGDYINPDALESAHQAISLLIEKIESLETEIKNISENR